MFTKKNMPASMLSPSITGKLNSNLSNQKESIKSKSKSRLNVKETPGKKRKNFAKHLLSKSSGDKKVKY